MKVKTIDVNVKEWFDKHTGNSYFSGSIIINFGMKTEKTLSMPFQYGYGEFYLQKAMQGLALENLIKRETSKHASLWSYCKDNSIILRAFKQENCLKRDL